jgi:hypothetical protein
MELKDFLNSINSSKKNLIDSDSKVERLYLPFIVNKCLSYFPDTILISNQINEYPHLDKKMQYDYYLYNIRPKKRFAPWAKKIEDENIDLIKKAYGVSDKKALEILDLLDSEKIEKIKKSQFIGGHK